MPDEERDDEIEVEVDELVPSGEPSEAMLALERARAAWERSNVQLQLDEVVPPPRERRQPRERA